MQIPECGVHVVELSRPLRLRGEPVLAREARVAEPAEQDSVAAQLRPVALDETAAVDQQHTATVRRGRPVEIGLEVAVASAPDRNRLRDNAVLFSHGLPRNG